MAFTTLVSPLELSHHLNDPAWGVIDCRYDLDEPDQAEADYRQSHIPGAFYANLLSDLCGTPQPGLTSRHPFPTVEEFSRTISKWGITPATQMVVYDSFRGGFAARLWRMLGWLGFPHVALLDGGWNGWFTAGFPTDSTLPTSSPGQVQPKLNPNLLVTTEEVQLALHDPCVCFLDARSIRSYEAGHIPGAVHIHYLENTDETGKLRPVVDLQTLYKRIIDNHPANQVIAYCTSGVTASLAILVMQYLGLGTARLYAGSWDEWSADPLHPIEQPPQT